MAANLLSSRARAIPARERLIFALDVPDVAAAKSLVVRLADNVLFYKIGLELAMTGQYFELLDWLLARDKKVFTDLKLYDIPATVGAAVRQLRSKGASFLTVHGDPAIMRAAADEKGQDLQVLAVTVLTSIGPSELKELGVVAELSAHVAERARQAVAAGCDGVIASGLEAEALRAELGAGPVDRHSWNSCGRRAHRRSAPHRHTHARLSGGRRLHRRRQTHS